MGSPFQQQALQRKLIYTVLIVVLLLGAWLWRNRILDPEARKLAITEESVGEVELTGSAVRLMLTGSRGFAVCGLWLAANQKQKKNQWNEMELFVRSITKLQPHFITPWLFQSWNLAYNVSVESDRVRDKYFYVSRGVQLLAEGERQNRNHPVMRYFVGYYQQHKICISDESNVLRSLYQMSSMPPEDRDPKHLWREGQKPGEAPQVDMVQFEKFCREHPHLVRRLREKLRCGTPAMVVQFLSENQKLPALYEDLQTRVGSDKRTPLKPELERFPMLPPPHQPLPHQQPWDPNELTSDKIDRLKDDFDAYAAARAWFAYAQEPLPAPGKYPGESEPIQDRTRQRSPFMQRNPHMSTAIFRIFPARAQHYIGERLEEEGWFDDEGWLITDWFPRDQFEDGKPARVGAGRLWAIDAWTKANQMWSDFGRRNKLLVPSEEVANQIKLAQPYEREYKVSQQAMPAPLKDEDRNNESMVQSSEAHQFIYSYFFYRKLTNFAHFYFQSQLEMMPQTVAARKAIFEAKQLARAGQRNKALERFEAPDAFAAWREILIRYPEFSQYDLLQEDLYETQVRYLNLMQDLRGKRFQEWLSIARYMGEAVHPTVGLAPYVTLAPLAQPKFTVGFGLAGPLDRVASDGRLLINPEIIKRVRVKLGLERPDPTPAAGARGKRRPPRGPGAGR